jgi:ABC-type Zn uptake system ZnuABC Zn-binding protein ZnuA
VRIRGLGLAFVAVTIVIGLTAPSGTPAQTQSADPVRVITTFSILGDIVSRVGGDQVEVSVLIPNGSDAHVFEPTPDDAGKLENAAVVFENGLGFEPWLDELFEASASRATRVVVTDGITPRATGGHEHDEDEDHENHEDHHGEFDPHVWHDVQNVIAEVGAIRAALATADPDNAAVYDANAAAYTTELQELDAYIVGRVATLPEDRRRLVTSHDTFGYFADRYGFEIVGTALGSLSTESGDPSARDINDLIEDIEDAGVPAIFAENVSNTDLMETIAAEADVALAPTLYTDSLGEPGSPGHTYLGMIRYNVDTIVVALGAS